MKANLIRRWKSLGDFVSVLSELTFRFRRLTVAYNFIAVDGGLRENSNKYWEFEIEFSCSFEFVLASFGRGRRHSGRF
jgi:hypothetical protein